LVGFLLSGRLVLEALRPSAVVTSPVVSGMSGPGEDYLELFTLHQAAEIRIVMNNNTWVWIELPDGRQAWLPEASIQLVNHP
jgi:hypothetical protein